MKTFSHYKNTPKYITEFAREMRRKPTVQEEKLWSHLRAKKLNGLKFRRQFPIGRYIVDFYNHDNRLIIEADGKFHNFTKEYDKKRTAYFLVQGYREIRFSNDAIDNNIESVLKVISENATKPPKIPGRGI